MEHKFVHFVLFGELNGKSAVEGCYSDKEKAKDAVKIILSVSSTFRKHASAPLRWESDVYFVDIQSRLLK